MRKLVQRQLKMVMKERIMIRSLHYYVTFCVVFLLVLCVSLYFPWNLPCSGTFGALCEVW